MKEVTKDKLPDEIKLLLKDYFVAVIRKKEDGLEIKFSDGQVFILALWENKKWD